MKDGKVPRWPFAIINLVCALGVCTVGLGVVVASGLFNLDPLFKGKFGDSFFVAMIIAGLAAIIASLLGCATFKIKSRTLAICYGAVLLPTFIILIVLAALLGSLPEDLTQFC
jgi:branched-subunit amino acid ABC-type transport system permease component